MSSVLTLRGVLDDVDDTLELLSGELTGALVQVDIGLLAGESRETTSNTCVQLVSSLGSGSSVGDLFTLDAGLQRWIVSKVIFISVAAIASIADGLRALGSLTKA